MDTGRVSRPRPDTVIRAWQLAWSTPVDVAGANALRLRGFLPWRPMSWRATPSMSVRELRRIPTIRGEPESSGSRPTIEGVRAMACVRCRHCGLASFSVAYWSNTEYCSRCSDQLPVPPRCRPAVHPRTLPNPPQSSGWRRVEDVAMTLHSTNSGRRPSLPADPVSRVSFADSGLLLGFPDALERLTVGLLLAPDPVRQILRDPVMSFRCYRADTPVRFDRSGLRVNEVP